MIVRRIVRGRCRDCAAVVVTYHPAQDLARNLKAIAPQVSAVYVIDNSRRSWSSRLRSTVDRLSNVEVHRLGVNVGIAAALDLGCMLAERNGFKWVVTLDQDSRLTARAVHQMRYSASQSSNVAIVAPLYRDAFTGDVVLPRLKSAKKSGVDVVITSGNLVKLAAWRAIGGFEWRLFIDAVDFDFCLRLARGGWRVIRSSQAELVHRLGVPKVGARLFGIIELRVRTYPAFRRYFQLRNGLLVVRRHFWVAPAWCLDYSVRLFLVAVKIALVEQRSFKACWRGIFDSRGRNFRAAVDKAQAPRLDSNDQACRIWTQQILRSLASAPGSFRHYRPR